MKKLLIALLICVMPLAGASGCAAIQKHTTHEKITYTTHDDQVIDVTNKNVQTFLNAVRVSSSMYTSTERGFAVVILNDRDKNGITSAAMMRNRVKAIDSPVVQSFEILVASIDLYIEVNQDIENGGSVPYALIAQAGDVAANIQRMLSLSKELGAKLPPGFDDALKIMEVISQ